MNVGVARQAKVLSDSDQLALQLPIAAPALTRASYIVSDSNRHAVDTLLSWRDANEPFLAICGAPKSGKTHLATILLEGGEAVCRHVNDKLLERDAASSAPLMLIDGVETLDDPRRLLAAVESVRARQGRLVLVGVGDPQDWASGMRDLRTRLAAMARISLEEPDETLLEKLIVKLLLDRQLKAPPAVASFAAPRLRKTFAAAHEFVDALDRASIASKRPVGIGLARSVLANLSEEESGP